MQTKPQFLLFTGLLTFLLLGCATATRNPAWREGRTTINVSGATGSAITCCYVRDGERHSIEGEVPFTFSETGVSEVEIRKGNPADSFKVETRFEAPEWRCSYANMVVPAAVPGVRVQLRKGFSVEHLTK